MASLRDNYSKMQSQSNVGTYRTLEPGQSRISQSLGQLEGPRSVAPVQRNSWWDRTKSYGKSAMGSVRDWTSRTFGWSPMSNTTSSGQQYTIPTQYYQGGGAGAREIQSIMDERTGRPGE